MWFYKTRVAKIVGSIVFVHILNCYENYFPNDFYSKLSDVEDMA